METKANMRKDPGGAQTGGRKPVPGMYILCLIAVALVIAACEKISDNSPDDDSPAAATVGMELVADNLVSPLSVVEAPDDSHRLFIVDQVGKVWIVKEDGTKLAEPFLDVSSKMIALSPDYDERGLLSLAFHPQYKSNGKFFVYYTAPPKAGGPEPGASWDHINRIAEFRVSGDPDKADMGSERIVLDIDQPQGNHNGGTIAFCDDGYLYVSIGDGGGADDVGPGHVSDWYAANEGGNGQDLEANLQGSILRIDINTSTGYLIPKDNPFVGRKGMDEIFAFGFRNPYRFSFDMGGKRQLFAGDAGQGLYEEVSIVSKGGNYGWNVKEGTHCFNAADNTTELPDCPDVDPDGRKLIDPVIEVNHVNNPKGGIATTIVGGNVYRGKEIPDFSGRYIFGIFSQSFTAPNAKIFIAQSKDSGLWSYEEIVLKDFPNDLGLFLKGFGQDMKGEIYLTGSTQLGPSGNTGKIYKLAMVD